MLYSRLRALKALYGLAMLVRDPSRLGEVFEISDALATPAALQPMVDRLSATPAIAKSFQERHRIRVDLAALRTLPKGTLGREFAEHMIANNLDPGALPTLVSDTAGAYFRAHLYETHDIWHVVTGFHTDLVGELGLQAFYLAQIPGPLPLLLVSIGFLRSAIYDEALTEPFMEAIIAGYRMGKDAVPFFGVKWDELWSVPIDEVRRRLRVTPTTPAHELSVAA